MLNNLLMGAAALLALSGCGSTSSTDTPANETSKGNKSEVKQAEAGVSDYLDGLTDANKGSKKIK